MKRTALVFCLAAITLFALVVPAFADTSGSVYGKAVLAPYAIVITGGGVDQDSPLTYQGNLGQAVKEEYDTPITVTNVGSMGALIKLDMNQPPTDGDSHTWNLAGPSSYGDGRPDTALWVFGNDGEFGAVCVLPPSDPDYSQYSEFLRGLPSGNSWTVSSIFVFPTSTSSMGDHYMSATFSAIAPS
jgi:hypothetical protein